MPRVRINRFPTWLRACCVAAARRGLPLALAALAGCGAPGRSPERLPDRSQWPRVYVLASPDLEPFLGPDHADNYAHYDGTILLTKIVPDAGLAAALRGGERADLVLTADAVTFEQLNAAGLLAPPPWRFTLRRDDLAIVTRADAPFQIREPADVLRQGAGRFVTEEQQPSTLGGLEMVTLQRLHLWEALQPRLLSAETAAEQRRALAAGRAGAALTALDEARHWGGRYRVDALIDPYPTMPRAYYGAVAAGSTQPIAAHRVWNYQERQMTNSAYLLGLVDRGG